MATLMAEGTRFGLLVVTGPVAAERVPVRCDCGTVKQVFRSNLVCGRTRSCGCQQGAAGIRRRRYSDAQIAAAVAMVNDGWTWQEAADRGGMDLETLRRRAVAAGLTARVGHTARMPTTALVNDPVELAYLAAMIDGEGYVSRRAVNGAWTVGVTNTDAALMRWLDRFGGTCVWGWPPDKGPIRAHKKIAQWRVQAQREVQALLRLVAPYMIIKRAKAQTALGELDARYGG